MMHEDVTFLIKSNHFHANEFCHPIGKDRNHVETLTINGIEMIKMSLENCSHGIAQAYIAKDDLQLFSNHRKKKVRVIVKCFS